MSRQSQRVVGLQLAVLLGLRVVQLNCLSEFYNAFERLPGFVICERQTHIMLAVRSMYNVHVLHCGNVHC